MKIVLAQVNGDGIEGDAGYGVEGAVQGIEVQEIVGLLADQDLADLLAEHFKAQARGAQCIENGILCGPVDLLGGCAVRAHLHHLAAGGGACHLFYGIGHGSCRIIAQSQ